MNSTRSRVVALVTLAMSALSGCILQSGQVAGNRLSIPLPDGQTIELERVPAGEYYRYTDDNDPDNRSLVHIVLATGYFIGKNEVSHCQWAAVMGSPHQSYAGDLASPVGHVTWYECISFCRNLSDWVGYQCRLPLESEWEYAAMLTAQAASFGRRGLPILERKQVAALPGETTGHALTRAQTVDRASLRALAILDMDGSMSEWCIDPLTLYVTAKDGRARQVLGTVDYRVIRGGSSSDPSSGAHGALFWSGHAPDSSREDIGFRVVVGGDENAARKAMKPSVYSQMITRMVQRVVLSGAGQSARLETGTDIELMDYDPGEGTADIRLSSANQVYHCRTGEECVGLSGVWLEHVGPQEVTLIVTWHQRE